MLLTEILTILISIMGMSHVEAGGEAVNMIPFGGEAVGPYFQGKVLPGGVDTQMKGNLSARYMLEGTDCDGQPCKIFIENNGKFGEPYTHPTILTDSKALSFLNGAELLGKLDGGADGLTIRISSVVPPIPDDVRQPAAQQGTIETFNYKAGKLKKHARVYVPYGYDKSDKQKKYNVVYLMHGGGDNTTSFLTPPQDWLRLKDVLDHLIADGKMDPVLVVCPTFYDDDEHIGQNRMQDAVAQTRNFNKELRKYLIPAVEKAYSTHYNGRVDESRDHRAFGGFSMGALCTWYQLADDVAAISRFLPLSGDLWVYDEAGQKQDAETAARWLGDQLKDSPYKNDFRVLGYSGSEDIAGTPQQNLVRALYSATALFDSKNLTFAMKPGGQHYYGDINQYLYRALPLLWEKK